MKSKKIAAAAIVTLLTVPSVFATVYGTENVSIWNKADEIADDSVSYVATSRDITLESLDEEGNVIKTDMAAISAIPANYGSRILRTIAGESDAVAFTDNFYDGSIITPFNDNLYDLDAKYLRDEVVNGVATKVYEASIALDKNLFFFSDPYKESGDIIGYDFDEKETNDDLVVTIWLDASTGALVKQENNYTYNVGLSNSKVSFKQTVLYGTAETSDGLVSLPSSVTTSGIVDENTKSPSIYNRVNFLITDLLDGYVDTENYKHGF